VIERDIRVGNAELRALSGRLEQALRRYESAFELGLTRGAVVGYLRTLARARGRAEARAALAGLRSRYPGHPALADDDPPPAPSPAR
jgi:hypothetical protein